MALEEDALSKQNKPVVRDGRLQAPKRRTDRSYLGTAPSSPVAEPDSPTPVQTADPAVAFQSPVPTATAPSAPAAATAVAAPAPATAPAAAARRRREVDPEELLAQDSTYAMHELRRVGVIAALILGTLIGLGVFMR